MPEGSVHVEGYDAAPEGSPEVGEATPVEEASSSEVESTETTSEATTTAEAPAEEVETVLTDKGTKLDPKPESAQYQLLANARRKLEKYEQILTDPKLYKEYAKTAGFADAPKEAPVELDELERMLDPEKLQTSDDVAAALRQFSKMNSEKSARYEQQIQELKQRLDSQSEHEKVLGVANTITNDISRVREKYPELDPKSASFNPELEKEIGEMYEELDFDQEAGRYRGNYSLTKIADRFMKTASIFKKAGATENQTIVKEKQMGKVVTGGKKSAQESEDDLTPEQTIARRISRVYKN
jgi:hypothetical protein